MPSSVRILAHCLQSAVASEKSVVVITARVSSAENSVVATSIMHGHASCSPSGPVRSHSRTCAGAKTLPSNVGLNQADEGESNRQSAITCFVFAMHMHQTCLLKEFKGRELTLLVREGRR